MRVFVFEYTCAVADPVAAGLHAEGWAMLHAVMEDLARIPGVEPIAMLATGLPRELAAGASLRIKPHEEEPAFRRLAQQCDWSLVIAPEFYDILEDRCRWVREAGGRLLGPSVEAIRLTGDKLALGRRWRGLGIPTPETMLLERGSPSPLPFKPSTAHPVICKPRHGAGAQATFAARTPTELERALRQARADMPRTDLLVQPFVSGTPASIAFIIGPGAVLPLIPAEQTIDDDGCLRYQGGRLPLTPRLTERAVRLGEKAVAAVPGLLGYVGVDVVLGAAADGSEDWAIEINPRLTTSYIGLRRLARFNLAQTMLQVVQGREAASLSWEDGSVVFTSAGEVTV